MATFTIDVLTGKPYLFNNTFGGTGSSTIISCNREIIFNSFDSFIGNPNLTYNYMNDSLQVNISSCASGQSSVAMAGGNAYGCNSIALGDASIACGDSSTAIGGGNASNCFAIAMGGSASGYNSFATNNSAAISDFSTAIGGGNAYACNSIAIGNSIVCSINSVAIGGQSNYIETGNTNTVLIGGNSIGVSANSYTNTVIIPNLIVWTDDIEIKNIGGGVIIKSPNGTRWRITIDNTGSFVSNAL